MVTTISLVSLARRTRSVTLSPGLRACRMVSSSLRLASFFLSTAWMPSPWGGRAAFPHAGQAHPLRGVLAEDAEDRRKGAHADLFAIDDGEDDVGVAAVVVEPDAAERVGGQAARQLAERLAAVGSLEDAAAG